MYDGEEGYDFVSSEEYDVVILDLMLPGMDGVTLCKKLREENNHTPILMLTAKGQIQDRVLGLNSGADDYLVKPFAFEELLARVRALTRRPVNGGETKLKISDLELDSTSYEVERGKKQIALTRREFALLEYLMRNPDRIITKDVIIAHVWDYDADILPNTVEVYIGYLRKKINLAEAVRQAIERNKPQAKEKKIKINDYLSEVVVKGDPQSLVELISILINNAIKYSNTSSSLSLSTRKYKKRAIIEVKDEGVGIAEKDIPHIFDRFYRADSSRSKTKTDGYGLGLSIARSIVDVHKGEIKVESEIGKGSTFTVIFPVLLP